MITIISSTNRPYSNSIMVAEYYKKLLSNKGVESQILDLAKLPDKFISTALYDNIGKDPEFNKFIDIINKSEKFIFIVPEYNGSFPGILKAFIDGLDYPGSFENKKCALTGISSGVMGGAFALSHLTDILNYMGMHVLAIKPRIARVQDLFKNGKINDRFIEELIDAQLNSFIIF
jgi:chromate reductase, NAD(P)H dehydrogenase (quinone)